MKRKSTVEVVEQDGKVTLRVYERVGSVPGVAFHVLNRVESVVLLKALVRALFRKDAS